MANEETPSTTDPKPKKRRWLRRLVKAGIVVLVLLLLAPLALSLGPVRNMIADGVGESLGADVTVAGASGYWFHGVDLEGIEIASPKGYEQPVAKIKQVHIDVGVFGLLGGSLDAEVEITEPVVTIRRKPDGGTNLDAIKAKLAAPADEEAKSESTATLRLRVVNGIVDAQGAYGVEPTRVEAINITASLGSGGAMGLALDALAKNAKVGGGGAAIKAKIALNDTGRGIWMIETSRLDLSRFSALLSGVDALRSIAGELEVSGSGEFLGDDAINGKLVTAGDRLAGETFDGARFGIQTLTGTLGGRQADAESTFTIDVDAKDVLYEMQTETGPLRFAEPLVTVDAKGAYQKQEKGNRVIVREATIAAGETLDAVATQPWMIALGEKTTAQGKAKITADFARLGSLRSLSSQLERLLSGRLVANVNARQGEGLDVAIGARIVGLRVASPIPGGLVYGEPDLIVQARYGTVDEKQRVDIYSIRSALVTTTGTSGANPLVVHLGPNNIILNGPLGLRVNAAALSLLAPDLLGLQAREVIEGIFNVTGNAPGDASKSTLTATIEGRGVRLPGRVDPSRTVGGITIGLRADMTPADLKLALTGLSGFGFTSGTGATQIFSETDGMRVGPGSLRAGLNLAVARPWLRPLAGLPVEARFAGQLTLDVKASERDDGLALDGTSYVENVFWQPKPTDVPLRDARISVDHTLWLAPEGERSTIQKLVLGLTGLSVDVSNSSFAMSEDEVDVDLEGTIRGDAARFAPTVAALLGPDYADMRGQGTIQGTLKFTGSPRRGGENLLLDVALSAGSWTSAGLSLANTQITARRAALADPISGAVQAAFNGGPTTVTGTLTPGPGRTPWRMAVNASRIDTSSLLVDRGPARFLAFALPATLPSDANVPVLSGLLSGQLQIASGDLADPAMLDELTGRGNIEMQQGEIKNSTLFSGRGGGGLDRVFKVLSVAVSEVGEVTKSITRALTFQSLQSSFTIGQRRVNVEQTKLAGRYVTLVTKGVVTFEQRVNLKTNMTFEGSAGKDVQKYLPDRTVPLRVTGVLPNAQVKPDLDLKKLAGSGLAEKAKDALKGLRGLIK